MKIQHVLSDVINELTSTAYDLCVISLSLGMVSRWSFWHFFLWPRVILLVLFESSSCPFVSDLRVFPWMWSSDQRRYPCILVQGKRFEFYLTNT